MLPLGNRALGGKSRTLEKENNPLHPEFQAICSKYKSQSKGLLCLNAEVAKKQQFRKKIKIKNKIKTLNNSVGHDLILILINSLTDAYYNVTTQQQCE